MRPELQAALRAILDPSATIAALGPWQQSALTFSRQELPPGSGAQLDLVLGGFSGMYEIGLLDEVLGEIWDYWPETAAVPVKLLLAINPIFVWDPSARAPHIFREPWLDDPMFFRLHLLFNCAVNAPPEGFLSIACDPSAGESLPRFALWDFVREWFKRGFFDRGRNALATHASYAILLQWLAEQLGSQSSEEDRLLIQEFASRIEQQIQDNEPRARLMAEVEKLAEVWRRNSAFCDTQTIITDLLSSYTGRGDQPASPPGLDVAVAVENLLDLGLGAACPSGLCGLARLGFQAGTVFRLSGQLRMEGIDGTYAFSRIL